MKVLITKFLIILPLLVYSSNENQEQAKQFVSRHLPGWLGWCSKEKAWVMMDLIFETNPKVCVEIGVFGGSSLFPTAHALKIQGSGIVYGIDPWDAAECIKNVDVSDSNYKWWSEQNMENFHKDCLQMIKGYRIDNQCIIIHDTSQHAAEIIPDSIDILHIDGNFSEESVYQDVVTYFPKVIDGGYIWLNDTKWTDIHGNYTKLKAINYLKDYCSVVNEFDNLILFKKL